MNLPSSRAVVSLFSVSVQNDGTAPFEGPDPIFPGTTNSGNDESSSNGIVRTYDTVTYRVNYATNQQPNTSTTITLTITDDDHLWDESQANCAANVAVSVDRKTLTCTELLDPSTTGFLDFSAYVLGDTPHGATLAVTAELNADGNILTSGPTNTTVSATPKMDLVKALPGVPRRDGIFTDGPSGEEGILYVWPLSIVAPKGSEMLGDADPGTPGDQIIITDVVSNISSNAQLYNWGGRIGCGINDNDTSVVGEYIRDIPYGSLSTTPVDQAARAVADSGTWTCSQAGGAGSDITITITDADLSGNHRPTLAANGDPLNADETYLVSGVVEIWIPTSDFPAGGNQLVAQNYYDFLETPSITGQPNVEPDRGGNASVPINDIDDVNNDRQFTLQRPLPGSGQYKEYRTQYDGGQFGSNGSELRTLFPMTDRRSGDGYVMPDQVYGAYFLMSNTGTGDITNAIVCDKFDNRTQILARNTTTGKYVEMYVPNSSRLNESEVIIDYGVGGDNASDSYYGDDAAAIDDAARFDAQRAATCEDADATWYTEAELDADPSLVPQVSRVRIRPNIVDGTLEEGRRIQAVAHLQALNIDPATGTQIADLNILANHVTSRSDEVDSGDWKEGTYRPEDHSGNDDGDRLRLIRAIARINKKTDNTNNATPADDLVTAVNAADNVTFVLEPTLTAFVASAPSADIVVTDTLPAELTYVSDSADITPDSVTVNGDDTTTLVWNLGNYSPNAVIPSITFQAQAKFDVAGGTTATNQTIVDALDGGGLPLDGSPESDRTAFRSITIANNAAFRISKSAVASEVAIGDDLVYDLFLVNLSPDTDVDAGSEFIDILPYEGDGGIRDAFDGAGTPPSDFTGTPVFQSIVDSDSFGFTFEYTNDAPGNISDDPATTNPSTVWCTPANITAGQTSCPSTDFSDVTAVKIIAPPIPAGTPSLQLQLTLSAGGNLGNDIYTNNFKGTPNHPSLGFIPSPDATIRTPIGPASPADVGDFVWADTNQNGLQDDGATGVAGVTVNLYNASDRANASATPVQTLITAPDGSYLFESVAPGDYFIEFEAPNNRNFVLLDAGAPNDDTLDSDADGVGRTVDFTVQPAVDELTWDAGLTPLEEPLLYLVKRITAINRGQADEQLFDSTANLTYVDVGTGSDADNAINWPGAAVTVTIGSGTVEGYIAGIANGSQSARTVSPGDELEYTLPFLSDGGVAAQDVVVCDLIPTNTTFISTAFNSSSPASPGFGNRGILLSFNNETVALTNDNDGDEIPDSGSSDGVGGYYFPGGLEPSTVFPGLNCGGSNNNGAVVVDLSNLPNATAEGTPANSFGYIRFRVVVD